MIFLDVKFLASDHAMRATPNPCNVVAVGRMAFEVPVELHGQHVGSLTGRVFVIKVPLHILLAV